MSFIFSFLGFALVPVLLYLILIDRAAKRTPPTKLTHIAPHHFTRDQILECAESLQKSPINFVSNLPPKLNRRYIVTGGFGVVGSCIVKQLLQRGEAPQAIRIIDIRSSGSMVKQYPEIEYIETDISQLDAVLKVFNMPWDSSIAQLPLTVFHTAAKISWSDSSDVFLSPFWKANVVGTENLLHAARLARASCFVMTSSGSVIIVRPNFWIWPWKSYPDRYVQCLDDHERHSFSERGKFFSNYAYTKWHAEQAVRSADCKAIGFRTGCIRPVNSIYGSPNDHLAGLILRKQKINTISPHTFQNMVHVEHVAVAHLLYEARLVDENSTIDLGGQAFCITDPNPCITLADLHLVLTTLSKSPVKISHQPIIPLLILSYLVLGYRCIQARYIKSLPSLPGDLAMLDPAVFNICCVNVVWSDERARKSPEEGGLGYNPKYTTLQGLTHQLLMWNQQIECGIKSL